MNERFVQTMLMRSMLVEKQHKALIPNSTQLLYGEADLLSVTKAGLVHEFEIKCSISDYKADFRNKKGKHYLLQHRQSYRISNYYWFVTYQFDIEPPTYAGWILVDNGWNDEPTLFYKKEAPRLHKEKWDDGQVAKIARLLSFRLLKEYEKKQMRIQYENKN